MVLHALTDCRQSRRTTRLPCCFFTIGPDLVSIVGPLPCLPVRVASAATKAYTSSDCEVCKTATQLFTSSVPIALLKKHRKRGSTLELSIHLWYRLTSLPVPSSQVHGARKLHLAFKAFYLSDTSCSIRPPEEHELNMFSSQNLRRKRNDIRVSEDLL
jgi:hypothetical protein